MYRKDFLYQGSFKYDKIHGYGIMYDLSRAETEYTLNNSISKETIQNPAVGLSKSKYKHFYRGEFKNGCKSGFGVLKYNNSMFHIGFYKNDIPHGKGAMVELSLGKDNKEAAVSNVLVVEYKMGQCHGLSLNIRKDKEFITIFKDCKSFNVIKKENDIQRYKNTDDYHSLAQFYDKIKGNIKEELVNN